MLLRDSWLNYTVIRTAIIVLRLITPASVVYCIAVPIFRPHNFIRGPLLPLSIWAIAETVFYTSVYLPLSSALQAEAAHPPPPSAAERRVLFQRCLDTVFDTEHYLSGWFLGASIADIKRENLKEFYAWSFLNKKYRDVDEAESGELDGYVDQLEQRLDRPFGEGYGKAQSLRGTMQGVYMQHRPLLWYLIVGVIDSGCHVLLHLNGYRFNRQMRLSSLATFPIRPFAILGTAAQPNTKFSYWYRKHTAKHRLPVLVLHGVGIGMYAYVNFLLELRRQQAEHDGEGDVGIIALELLPVSARISAPTLAADETREEVRRILDKHGWKEFVLVGHSYGTAIAASILRDPQFETRVKAAVLMDPICFLLHWPDVAYNFTRREPTTTSEYMLHYFSSRDMMISHTFARRFFWTQYILWKDDVANLPLTVTLSARDIIVPTKAVWEYLISNPPQAANGHSTSEGLDAVDERLENGTVERQVGLLKVVLFEDFNHASLFSSKGAMRGVVRQIYQYSGEYGGRSEFSQE